MGVDQGSYCCGGYLDQGDERSATVILSNPILWLKLSGYLKRSSTSPQILLQHEVLQRPHNEDKLGTGTGGNGNGSATYYTDHDNNPKTLSRRKTSEYHLAPIAARNALLLSRKEN